MTSLCYDVPMAKKQKLPFRIRLGNKKILITKSRLEWTILIILIGSAVLAQVSGLYPYVYNYAKCQDAPIEVRGSYYRVFVDDSYGIHPGSDYSHCLVDTPSNLQRDPSTKVGAKLVEEAKKQAIVAKNRTNFTDAVDGYTVYTPQGFNITKLSKAGSSDYIQTLYSVPYNDITFSVSEGKKSSDFSYTNLCSRPANGSWSGVVIGSDDKGRDICRTNINKYINNYVVGINIGNTAIMLKAPLDKSDAELNAAATALFSSMKPYTN